MSLQQTAFIVRAAIPHRAALQAAIDDLGFDFTLGQSFAPFQCSGYLPCVVAGKDSGFEIYFEPAEAVLCHFPTLKSIVEKRDAAITFRWGGDMSECACVMIVSAALSKSFGAVVHYQDDDMLYTAEQLIDEAGSALQAM